MRFSISAAVLAVVAATASAQNTITVLVGDQGSVAYSPSSITANTGDTVVFQFMAKNHTVTQSTFADPCSTQTSPSQGIDSGFVPVNTTSGQIPQWSFEITNNSVPLWFYCRQTGHCQQGMVFAINPTADKTFDAFQAKAKSGTSPSSSSSATATSSGFVTSTSASSTSTGTSSSVSGTSTAKPNGASKVTGSASALALIAVIAAAML